MRYGEGFLPAVRCALVDNAREIMCRIADLFVPDRLIALRRMVSESICQILGFHHD